MKLENTNRNERIEKERLILKGKHIYKGKVSIAQGLKIGFFNIADENSTIKSTVIEPEHMSFVFPGDTVQCQIETYENPENHELVHFTNIISIIDTQLIKFVGVFYIENDAHYVIPDYNGYSKKIRIPNAFIGSAKEGDYLECEIITHPFNGNRKAKAKIISVIGHSSTSGIETEYISRKNGIRENFTYETIKEVVDIEPSIIEEKLVSYLDMRDKCFISIDGNNTIDIDDAIFIEKIDDNYRIDIAISDVASFVIAGSEIDKEAKKRASSVYYLGRLIPMLPTKLSTDLCSLKANVDRLTIVCSVSLNKSGEIISYSFNQAIINSKAKLNYNEVENYVFHGSELCVSDEIKTVIKNLYSVYNILSQRRKDNNLVHDFGKDFKILLDSTGSSIKDIVPQDKNVTMGMIEECMIMANMLAGRFLYKHYGDKGIYRVNNGLRIEGMEYLLNVLQTEVNGNITESMMKSLDGFKSIIKQVENTLYDSEQELVTKPITNRTKQLIRNCFDSSSFSKQGLGHYGLGLEQYTFFTSPIRRYPDLIVHRMIKAILNNLDLEEFEITDDDLEAINDSIKNINRSTRELENWLKSRYLQLNFSNTTLKGKVLSVEKSGVRIMLESNGIIGNLPFTKFNKEKYGIKFDLQNHNFSLNNTVVNLSDEVNINFDKYDFYSKKIIFKDICV